MAILKHLTLLGGLLASVSGQAIFDGQENSADVLNAVQAADASTRASSQAATAYTPDNATAVHELTFQNYVLRSDWQYIHYVAESSSGFYTDDGAQAIIDFVVSTLFPDTKSGDQIYTDKRQTFIDGGFIGFINPGLIQLRIAVSQASAAIKSKTKSNKLTAMSNALLLIEQNYADTQNYQQYGTWT